MPPPHRPRRTPVHPTERDKLKIFTPDKISVQSIVDKEIYRRDQIERQSQQIEHQREQQQPERATEPGEHAAAPCAPHARISAAFHRLHDVVEEESEDQHRHRRKQQPGEEQRGEIAGERDERVEPGNPGDSGMAEQRAGGAPASRRASPEASGVASALPQMLAGLTGPPILRADFSGRRGRGLWQWQLSMSSASATRSSTSSPAPMTPSSRARGWPRDRCS